MNLETVSIGVLRVGIILSKFLLGSFIAKYMGFDELAIFGFVVGTAAVVQVFMRFGIYTSICRSVAYYKWSRASRNLVNYFSFISTNYLLILPVFIFLTYFFDNNWIFIYTFFILYFEHISQDIYNLAISLRFNRTANILLFLQSSSWVYIYIFFGVYDKKYQTLYSIFNFWILASLSTLILSMWLVRKWYWKISLKKYIYGYLATLAEAKKSWRIFFSELISTFNMYIDRYILSIFIPMEMVGIYIFFWQISNSINNVVGASVLQVSRTEIIRSFKNNDLINVKVITKKVLKQSLGMTLGLSILFLISIPLVSRVLDKVELKTHVTILIGLLIATLLRVGMDNLKLVTFAKHKDFELLISNLSGLILLVFLSVILIPIIGLYGSIFASIFSIVLTSLYVYKVNLDKV